MSNQQKYQGFLTATIIKKIYKNTFQKNFLKPDIVRLLPLLSCLGLSINHLKQLQSKIISSRKMQIHKHGTLD